MQPVPHVDESPAVKVQAPPELVVMLPAAQLMHVVWPVESMYCPAAHKVQAAAAYPPDVPGLTEPSAQSWHTIEVVTPPEVVWSLY